MAGIAMGVSAATLGEVAFAYLKKYGATRMAETPGTLRAAFGRLPIMCNIWRTRR
jgi:hypothetical protein